MSQSGSNLPPDSSLISQQPKQPSGQNPPSDPPDPPDPLQAESPSDPEEPRDPEEPTDSKEPKKPNIVFKLLGKGFGGLSSYFELRGPKSPFRDLARVHALSAAGDAMIILALSNSLFFSMDPNAARVRVLLYLLLSIAPFAVVAPIIGPITDRFKRGRRMVIILLNLSRTLVAFLMIGRQDSLLLFPLAFAILVLGKSYAVAKASIVPSTSESKSELVSKNSKLAVLSGVMGFVGIVIASPFHFLGGTSFVIGLGALTWLLASVASFRLPAVKLPQAPPKAQAEAPDLQKAQPQPDPAALSQTPGQMQTQPRLKRFERIFFGKAVTQVGSGSIVRTAYAMGILRASIGFMSFLFAFGFRGVADDVDLSGLGKAVGAGVRDAIGFNVETGDVESPLRLGILLLIVVLGTLSGSFLSPKLRRDNKEEGIIKGSLIAIAIAGLVAFWLWSYLGAIVLGYTVGFGVSASKVSFDSIVQRDAPNADYGKSFGSFEAFFQLAWVLGAATSVLISIPPSLGFFIIGLLAIFTWIIYVLRPRKRDITSKIGQPNPVNQSGPATSQGPPPPPQ